jgi:ankyrin repeat protein
LHEATRGADVNWLESLLGLEEFDVNARNLTGETPLHIALEVSADCTDHIWELLLSKGAATEWLSVDKVPGKKNGGWLVLEENLKGGRSMSWRKPDHEFHLPYGGPQSIWLLK